MRFIFKSFLAIVVIQLLGLHVFAQMQRDMKTDLSITKIAPNFIKTPEFSIPIGPIKKSMSRDWLEVEVEFAWEPPRVESKYLDEVTFSYYILLNNKTPQNPQGTLLKGEVTHVAISIGKGMRSVMYVSPRTLEKFFDGKIPSTKDLALIDVGITITKQGQLMAYKSWKGTGTWWSNYQQTAGYVLNKNETPFAPLFWDYYEAIKARPAGL